MSSADPTLLEPVLINILILADGRLRFDDEGFGLSSMIESLHEKAGLVVCFSTTTAYRRPKEHIRLPGEDSNGEGSDFAHFLFNKESFPKDYDEAWIFGDQEEFLDENNEPLIITTQLRPDEITALSEFMQKRGGVFATGDHGNLGASINAHLPRVRAMRTWHDGPPVDGGKENDTRNEDAAQAERDAIPQKLNTHIYQSKDSAAYPHPLLNGPRGAINVLPDHMHEGVCLIDPMANDFMLDNLRPLVIAESKSRSQLPHSFAAIAAYDGHLADVGRVVVDASFHHFNNLNRKGFLSTPPLGSGETPNGIDTGVYAYEDIANYYRNIAIWLAPPKKQEEIFKRALWTVRWRSGVYPLLAPETGAIKAAQIDPELDGDVILKLGQRARMALAQLTSVCFTFLWSIETLKRLTKDEQRFSSLYPWTLENELPPDLLPDSTSADGERVIEYMIGGVMIEMALRFPRKPTEVVSNPADVLEEILRKGAEIGLKAFESSNVD